MGKQRAKFPRTYTGTKTIGCPQTDEGRDEGIQREKRQNSPGIFQIYVIPG